MGGARELGRVETPTLYSLVLDKILQNTAAHSPLAGGSLYSTDFIVHCTDCTLYSNVQCTAQHNVQHCPMYSAVRCATQYNIQCCIMYSAIQCTVLDILQSWTL